MRTLPLLTALAAASMIAAVSGFGATAVTAPVGFNRLSTTAGTFILSSALVQEKAFQGQISDATASTLIFPGSPFTTDAFNEAAGQPTHFVEVLAGAHAGLILDIIHNTANTITVDVSVAHLGLTGSESMAVRPHTTLGNLFHATTLAPGNAILTLFDVNGGSEAFVRTSTGWGVNDFVSANHRVIYPGQGFLLSSDSPAQSTILGCVKTGATQLTVGGGDALNVVSGYNSAPGVTLAASGIASAMVAGESLLVSYSNDGRLTPTAHYQITGLGFVNIDTQENADAVEIPVNSAFLLVRPGTTAGQLLLAAAAN